MCTVKSSVHHNRIGDHLITFDAQNLNVVVIAKNQCQISFGTVCLQHYPSKDQPKKDQISASLITSGAFDPEEVLQLFSWLMEQMGVKITTTEAAAEDSIAD